MPRTNPKPSKRPPQPPSTPETVDPIWLVKAIAATVLVAIICGYLALCLLFYQGQWQLVLHPARTATAPVSIDGVPYQLIHFGPDDSAIPQLTGWWIPAAPTARYSHITLLFLPQGDGSLVASIPLLSTLHSLGLNIFAFDYRGYGQSAETHPNQQKMTHDADDAWQYLTSSRAISADQIVPYGIGVGASLAAHLAATHPTIPALILDSPHTDLLDVVRHDPRSGLIPLNLLFHENFALAESLKTLRTPKLLLSNSKSPDKSSKAYSTASNPKSTVAFSSPTQPLFSESIAKFLDQYLPSSTPQLVPSPAPVR
jgi:pimeloyl-ACP methyl ester carboxylesterase